MLSYTLEKKSLLGNLYTVLTEFEESIRTCLLETEIVPYFAFWFGKLRKKGQNTIDNNYLPFYLLFTLWLAGGKCGRFTDELKNNQVSRTAGWFYKQPIRTIYS
jgi:hypothetical protein